MNLVKSLLDGLFPEFVRVFKDPGGLTSLSVLATCSIPGVIVGMTENEFIAIIEGQHHGRRLRRKKLGELRSLAKTSIGIEAGARSLSIEVSFLVEKLKLTRGHIQIIERTLVRLVDETEESKYLLSIVGLSYVSVAGIIAELGSYSCLAFC